MRSLPEASSKYCVRSCGLSVPAEHGILPFVRDHLAARGLDVSAHAPRAFSRSDIETATLIVALGAEHQLRLKSEFGHNAPLFSQLAYGSIEPLRDLYEVVPNWKINAAAAEEYGVWVMNYIIDGMPTLAERLPEFFNE